MNKFLKNKSDIIAWLDQYNITNYELIENDKYGYVAHVDSDVDLSGKSLKYMPIKFGNINGSFYCYSNKLSSLEYCPQTIKGNFSCHNNKLSSLEFCPATVDGYFDCSSNNLKSLEFCPHTIGGGLSCENNKLTNLQFCPTIIGSDFYCHNNNLTSLEFCPTTINGDFICNNNGITNLIHFPSHIDGDIYLKMNKIAKIDKNKYYNFEELYPIHLEHKIAAEKKLLDNSISKSIEYGFKRIIPRQNNKLKI